MWHGASVAARRLRLPLMPALWLAKQPAASPHNPEAVCQDSSMLQKLAVTCMRKSRVF